MSDVLAYLNLGCGSRYHPNWINIDMVPQGPKVIQHDFSRCIPLADKSCDVVYHAAVLEHLRRSDAKEFLSECYRVMKPGGILRVGTPDLEKICQLYLSTLAGALNGDPAAAHDYEWIMIELYDQTVREKSGGKMKDYLRQSPLPNDAFVFKRIGEEGRQLVETLRKQDAQSKHSPHSILHNLRRKFRTFPSIAKSRILNWLLGTEDRRALEIGRFRLSGEAHQWMYDRFSLAQLLGLIGFHDAQLQDANTSRIPDWSSFQLDTLPDGQAIKPDLFFMEAIRPKITHA